MFSANDVANLIKQFGLSWPVALARLGGMPPILPSRRRNSSCIRPKLLRL